MTDDELLKETIARHFPGARIDDTGVELAFGDVRMDCYVNAVRDFGPHKIAHLYFGLRGGALGERSTFAAVSGYGSDGREAIVGGACQWACTFGPVLRAALAGEPQPEVDRFEVTRDGQRFAVHVDGLDRMLGFGDDVEDPNAIVATTRKRFAPRVWLARAVLESDALPLLHDREPTVLSVFVSESAGQRVVEVKVGGVDWPDVDRAFAAVPPTTDGGVVLMRELAIVTPVGGAASLDRVSIVRTLGVAHTRGDHAAIAWPGWQQHGGVLDAPMSSDALTALQARVGPLPAGYHAFLVDVAASGAGPGYGLLVPGAFVPGSFTGAEVRGVLTLARAGCGVEWVLVVAEGAHRGEVWADARGCDGELYKVAASFDAWYRDWLRSVVRDEAPWTQWNTSCCAAVKTLVQVIEAIEADGITGDARPAELQQRLRPGSVSLVGGDGAALDPCHGCTSLFARFGLEADRFTRAPVAPTKKRGFFAKLFG